MGKSDGSGLTLVDPQAWYYWHTGNRAYWNQILDYVDGGINGGAPPYGDFTTWAGQFEGRYYLYAATTPRPDQTPPPPIVDLEAWHDGNQTRLRWTAPAEAVRYHIVWSGRPIVAEQSLDPNVRNWWAANAVGPTLTPEPGAKQTLLIETQGAKPIYAVIFTFDAADNMSVLSNVALASEAEPTPVPELYLPFVEGKAASCKDSPCKAR